AAGRTARGAEGERGRGARGGRRRGAVGRLRPDRDGASRGGPPMRVAIYLRVSTGQQTVENQRRDLRAYCEARGWLDVVEYVDHGISGTKDRRPALDTLMRDVRARKRDVVVVAAFDRF